MKILICWNQLSMVVLDDKIVPFVIFGLSLYDQGFDTTSG
jgi:hypothetical protein